MKIEWFVGSMDDGWEKAPAMHATLARSRKGARKAAESFFAANPQLRRQLLVTARKETSSNVFTNIHIIEVRGHDKWRPLSDYLQQERDHVPHHPLTREAGH